ncbi:hypothetical protein K439DRAFT_1612182 [Ramaria rubella]|nr:hypothetical protein K439DRAFT_1612182 [Ramaria rubella]
MSAGATDDLMRTAATSGKRGGIPDGAQCWCQSRSMLDWTSRAAGIMLVTRLRESPREAARASYPKLFMMTLVVLRGGGAGLANCTRFPVRQIVSKAIHGMCTRGFHDVSRGTLFSVLCPSFSQGIENVHSKNSSRPSGDGDLLSRAIIVKKERSGMQNRSGFDKDWVDIRRDCRARGI